MALDQQTKTKLKDHFSQIKAQLQTLDPNMSDKDLEKAKTDPDTFIQDVADSTGQSTQDVERQVKQFATG